MKNKRQREQYAKITTKNMKYNPKLSRLGIVINNDVQLRISN